MGAGAGWQRQQRLGEYDEVEWAYGGTAFGQGCTGWQRVSPHEEHLQFLSAAHLSSRVRVR